MDKPENDGYQDDTIIANGSGKASAKSNTFSFTNNKQKHDHKNDSNA